MWINLLQIFVAAKFCNFVNHCSRQTFCKYVLPDFFANSLDDFFFKLCKLFLWTIFFVKNYFRTAHVWICISGFTHIDHRFRGSEFWDDSSLFRIILFLVVGVVRVSGGSLTILNPWPIGQSGWSGPSLSWMSQSIHIPKNNFWHALFCFVLF